MINQLIDTSRTSMRACSTSIVHKLHGTDNEERVGGSKRGGQIVNTVAILCCGDMQFWNVESSLNLGCCRSTAVL